MEVISIAKSKAFKPIPVARCQDCGLFFVPPVYLCADCGSTKVNEVQFNGRGILTAYTIIRTPPSDLGDQVPYTLAIVELENGLKIPCRLLGDPVSYGLEPSTPVNFVERKNGVYWFRLVHQRRAVADNIDESID